MNCYSCNNDLPYGARHCPQCGVEIFASLGDEQTISPDDDETPGILDGIIEEAGDAGASSTKAIPPSRFRLRRLLRHMNQLNSLPWILSRTSIISSK